MTSEGGPLVDVRPLGESDLAAADRVMRLAFGTFFGLPEPTSFMGDADYVYTRLRADPSAAFVAECGGEIVGSNFATQWGTLGFFGPLTIRPDLWDRGIGRRLIEPVLDCFLRWQTTQAVLFTSAQSAKHLALYQKFEFWPQFLIAVMSKPVNAGPQMAFSQLSDLPCGEQDSVLAECRNITDTVCDGLDVTREVYAVADHALGDTVLLWQDSKLTGFAVCHWGKGTEAGSGVCYVKFGAKRPGPGAEQRFDALLSAVEQTARTRGLARIVAGMNAGRREAYKVMLARGFRSDLQGIAMHRLDADGRGPYARMNAFIVRSELLRTA